MNDDHGVSCNCECCWWAHDCREVDEFGVSVEVESDESDE